MIITNTITILAEDTHSTVHPSHFSPSLSSDLHPPSAALGACYLSVRSVCVGVYIASRLPCFRPCFRPCFPSPPSPSVEVGFDNVNGMLVLLSICACVSGPQWPPKVWRVLVPLCSYLRERFVVGSVSLCVAFSPCVHWFNAGGSGRWEVRDARLDAGPRAGEARVHRPRHRGKYHSIHANQPVPLELS